MKPIAKHARVAAIWMTANVAQRKISAIARRSEMVVIGLHARERMLLREIDDADVFRVLREGSIVDDPEPAQAGEWKCKMIRKIRGARDVGVVTIILRTGKLFVKTVEWEDQN